MYATVLSVSNEASALAHKSLASRIWEWDDLGIAAEDTMNKMS